MRPRLSGNSRNRPLVKHSGELPECGFGDFYGYRSSRAFKGQTDSTAVWKSGENGGVHAKAPFGVAGLQHDGSIAQRQNSVLSIVTHGISSDAGNTAVHINPSVRGEKQGRRA